jgi:hypothetical protein
MNLTFIPGQRIVFKLETDTLGGSRYTLTPMV